MSKKTKVVITIIALCFGLIFVGTKAYATTGKAINESTRIRKSANTDSEVVAVMKKGEKIEILSEEKGWYKVEYKEGNNKTTGYVRNDLLDVEGKKKEEAKKEEVKVEEILTSSAKTEEKEEKNEEVVEETNMDAEVEQEEIEEDTELQLTTDTDLQLLPVIFSCKTGRIAANTKISVVEVIGNWTRIEAEDQEGWVLTSKIQSSQTIKNEDTAKKEETKKEEKTETTTKKMYVSTVTLNLREKADTNSKIVTQLNQNDEVIVIKKVDNTWSQVKTGNYEGYIASKYLSSKKIKETTSRGSEDIRNSEAAKKAEEEAKKKEEEEAKKKAEAEAKKKAEEEAKKKAEAAKKKAEEETKKKNESTTNKTTTTSKKTTTSSKKSSKVTGGDIIAYAKKYLGYRYVYGTAGPNTFDCSGFTSYVYKHFGYSLNRTSGGQRSNGKKVSKSDLQPGDILCFSGHVGLYIGGNKFIHAANPRKGVIISSLSESYYVKTYITARRIL